MFTYTYKFNNNIIYSSLLISKTVKFNSYRLLYILVIFWVGCFK